MALNFSYNDEPDDFSEESENEFNIGDSIIFLVDGTEKMYKNGYFTKCLETYRNIVKQKCSLNRKEKMGLLLFGTKETNCGVDNVMTLQEFEPVTIDTLKNIQNILEDGNDKYEEQASDTKYPLYDALSRAFQVSQNSKTNKKIRNIIVLCTCNDNPCADVPTERRRIEHLISTFKDNQTELCVVGLSDDWNDEIYYKDLQVISGTFSNDDYKRTYLEDFEQNILTPARSVGRVPWKISSNISIEVAVMNLVSSPRYPSKIKLQKDDHEILEGRHFLCEPSAEYVESENNITDWRREKKVFTSDNLIYCKSYNGSDVFFQPSEQKKMKNLGLDPCIEILAFKPIACDPMYHYTSPYFITYTTPCDYEKKVLFMSLISKCAEKKVMPVCKVVTKYAVYIAMMIPSEDDGGFYLYRMPFSDSIRDLDTPLEQYIYNSEQKCPINQQAVYMLRKLMELTKITFDPKLFTNPKLEGMIAHLEALAFDIKTTSLPPDRTLPSPISGNVENLRDAISKLLNLKISSNKRPNSQEAIMDKRQKLDILAIATSRKLHTLTVADLKLYLTSMNQSTSGNKAVLIDRIYKYLEL